MKKLILFAMITLLAGSLAAEDYIHTTFYSDGTKKSWPNAGVTVRMLLNGVQVDFDELTSGTPGNYRASDSMIVCTLQTTLIGLHRIYVTVGDGTERIDAWDGDYDNRIGRIADTVYALLDTLQDGVNGPLVDIRAISTDQTAANNLETMLDSTGGKPLTVSQIVVTASGDNDGVVIRGSGTGSGMHLIPGASSVGGGLYAQALSGNAHGILTTASGSGSGLFAYGPGGTGKGITAVGTLYDFWSDMTGSITGSISGSVEGLGATGVDAIWNEDTSGHGTAKSFAVMLKDTSAYQGPAGTLTADAIWEYDTSLIAGGVGNMLKDTSVYQGAAGSLDSAVVQGAVIAALNADTTMKVKKINLRQLVIGGENNDSASIYVYNNGTTPAVQFEGDGELGDPTFYIHSDSGHAFKMITDNKTADGTGSSTYGAFWAEAKGKNAYGGYFVNSNEESTETATGAGLKIGGTGWNNGLTIAVGEAGDTVGYTGAIPNNKAINVEGPSNFYGRNDWRRLGINSDNAITFHGVDSGIGFYAYSDEYVGARISTATGDTSMLIGGNVVFGGTLGVPSSMQGIVGNLEGTVDDIDSAITANVDWSGVGPYTVTLHTIDTGAAPDSAVPYIKLEINTAAGAAYLRPKTETGGNVVLKMDSGSYRLSGSGTRYSWAQNQLLTVTANVVDSIFGYSTYDIYEVTAPANSTMCQVYGYVKDQEQNAVKYAKVTISPPRDQRYNVCDQSQILTMKPLERTTDANGYFTATVLKSSCMPDTLAEYSIQVIMGNIKTRTETFVIPRDSASYKIGAFQ